MDKIILKKNEERRLLAGHLWIYSNEIDNQLSPLKNFTKGSLALVETANKRKLGIAYINPHTLLSARILTQDSEIKIDRDFFNQHIKNALQLRELCFNKPFYRLIYSESDSLPGLIVDRYGEVLVAQITTAGMENLKDLILEALIITLKPKTILWRNDSSTRALENLENYAEIAYGQNVESTQLEENDLHFSARVFKGQKTGWFYDQRNNRLRLKKYVKNQRVLDVFSYSGSFGITAAAFGAKLVACIDASKSALEEVKHNASLNQVQTKINTINGDAFNILKDLIANKEVFDVIILDPPAFIKRHKDFAVGINAYLRLHEMALHLLNDDGILLTTSCSQHLSRDDLLNIIRKASINTKTKLVILEQLHQAEDHPLHPAITETNYLKGFIARVNKNVCYKS